MAFKVEVTGLRQIVDALNEVDKKAVKVIKKEIATVAEQVVTNAQGRVSGLPISGWGNWSNNGRDLGFDIQSVVTGIKVKANRFRSKGVNRGFGYDVVNSNAGGSIFEVVGDKSRVVDARGGNFVDAINARFGAKRPRLLMPAYYSAVTPEVKERIAEQITNEARKAGLV